MDTLKNHKHCDFKKNIFIFIGTGKTGSTAIQKYCLDNLKNIRFYYPRSCISEYGHHKLSGLKVNPEKYLNLLAIELQSIRDYKNIFISSEELIYANKHTIHQLNKLMQKLGFNVKIIMSYRNLYDAVLSHYYEEIFQGKYFFDNENKKKMNYIGSLEEYYEHHKASFNYLTQIIPWAREFGKENIITFLYDKKYYEKNLIEKFLKIIDPSFKFQNKEYYPKNLFKKIITMVNPGFKIQHKESKHVHKSLSQSDCDKLICQDKLNIDSKSRRALAVKLKKFSSNKKIDISIELKNKINDDLKYSNKIFVDLFVRSNKQRKIYSKYHPICK